MDAIQLSNLLIEGESKEFVISITTDKVATLATGLVGFGSIIVSLALVWVTRKNQVSQNKIQIMNASLSHLNSSQEEGAKYISLAIQVGNLIRKGVDINSSDFILIHSKLLYHKSNLTMMLPSKLDQTDVIISLLNTCTESVLDTSVLDADVTSFISDLNEQLSRLFKEKRTELLKI